MIKSVPIRFEVFYPWVIIIIFFFLIVFLRRLSMPLQQFMGKVLQFIMITIFIFVFAYQDIQFHVILDTSFTLTHTHVYHNIYLCI